MKVYVYTHDPILHMMYNEEEARDLFGDCDEHLVDVSEELYEKFLKAKNDLYEISDVLQQKK